MHRRNLLKYGLATLSAAALPAPALAYPDRNIRMIVPFSAGGATDVAARLWAEKMKNGLGTVVIENKGGGGGAIGTDDDGRLADPMLRARIAELEAELAAKG